MRSRRTRLLAGTGALTATALASVWSQRRHLAHIASDPDNEFLRDPPQGRPLTIRSMDGTGLHAEVFGAEGAQTLILAHGWTEMLTHWAFVIRALSPRYRIVAYDLRGHGHSDRAIDGDYAIDRFGEDLEAVLDQTVPDGRLAVVVGHSLGAMSIAAWAKHHDVERRASGAALLNTGFGNLVADTLLIPVPRVAAAINRVVAPDAFLKARAPVPRFSTPVSSAIVHYVAFGPAATPARVAFYERMLVECPSDVRSDVGISLSEVELYDALPRLTVPTVVLAGADDRLTPPSHAEKIAAEVPQLRELIILPDTGHMSPLERPREVSAALDRLATSVASGSPMTSR